MKPKRGSIIFNGRDVTGSRAGAIARAGMGFVPEGRGVFPNLTAEENLVFADRPGPGGRMDWTREAIYESFPRLAERRKNWGNQLSGGEQQMLMIGRALLSNPRIVLIDEATEGLAPKVRDDIWSTLRIIARKGVAVVVVDKNIDDLVDLAGRHVVLARGRSPVRGDIETVARRVGVRKLHARRLK